MFPENDTISGSDAFASIKQRRTYHQIKLDFYEDKEKAFEGLVDVKAYYTILTQNKEVAKIIKEIILTSKN